MQGPDELLRRVGADLGVTDWVTVRQDDVEAFARATRAEEWIHVDPERARREGPFGGPVAHGYLTMALATRFVTELLGGAGGLVGVNYGLERVRFPQPLPVGSRVRAHGRLVSAQRQAGGVRTVISLMYEGDGLPKPPCVADVVSLILDAAASQPAPGAR